MEAYFQLRGTVPDSVALFCCGPEVKHRGVVAAVSPYRTARIPSVLAVSAMVGFAVRGYERDTRTTIAYFCVSYNV